jgi:hypothetical protein
METADVVHGVATDGVASPPTPEMGVGVPLITTTEGAAVGVVEGFGVAEVQDDTTATTAAATTS